MARSQYGIATASNHHDELDALFEGEHGMSEVFETARKESTTIGNSTRSPKEVTYERTRPADVLGDDEEIKITKKRAPIAKLDEARLLSNAGILKLQKLSKTRFKFRGKGHEVSDVAHLLRTYQLWLDDLYPRAKFADGLNIIERLGHTKRMQVRRKAWIEESKPRISEEEKAGYPEANLNDTPSRTQVNPREPIFESSAERPPPRLPSIGGASPHPESTTNEFNSAPVNTGGRPNVADGSLVDSRRGEPDEDELDALLAEEMTESGRRDKIASRPDVNKRDPVVDMFLDDDEDAMGDRDELW